MGLFIQSIDKQQFIIFPDIKILKIKKLRINEY